MDPVMVINCNNCRKRRLLKSIKRTSNSVASVFKPTLFEMKFPKAFRKDGVSSVLRKHVLQFLRSSGEEEEVETPLQPSSASLSLSLCCLCQHDRFASREDCQPVNCCHGSRHTRSMGTHTLGVCVCVRDQTVDAMRSSYPKNVIETCLGTDLRIVWASCHGNAPEDGETQETAQ